MTENIIPKHAQLPRGWDWKLGRRRMRGEFDYRNVYVAACGKPFRLKPRPYNQQRQLHEMECDMTEQPKVMVCIEKEAYEQQCNDAKILARAYLERAWSTDWVYEFMSMDAVRYEDCNTHGCNAVKRKGKLRKKHNADCPVLVAERLIQ